MHRYAQQEKGRLVIPGVSLVLGFLGLCLAVSAMAAPPKKATAKKCQNILSTKKQHGSKQASNKSTKKAELDKAQGLQDRLRAQLRFYTHFGSADIGAQVVEDFTNSVLMAQKLGYSVPDQQFFIMPHDALTDLVASGGSSAPHWLDGLMILSNRRPGVMEFVEPGCPYCRSFYHSGLPRKELQNIADHVMGHNHMSEESLNALGRGHALGVDRMAVRRELAEFLQKTYDEYGEKLPGLYYRYLFSVKDLVDLTGGRMDSAKLLTPTPNAKLTSPEELGDLGLIEQKLTSSGGLFQVSSKVLRNPPKPTPSILTALKINMPPQAPEWQKRLLELTEEQAQFSPVFFQTQVINEGWATFSQMLLERARSDESVKSIDNTIKLSQLEMKVRGPSEGELVFNNKPGLFAPTLAERYLGNVYWVGTEAWVNIYNKFQKRPEIKSMESFLDRDRAFVEYATQIIRTHNDAEFLKLGLDDEWIKKHRLNLSRVALEDEVPDAVIQRLIDSLGMAAMLAPPVPYKVLSNSPSRIRRQILRRFAMRHLKRPSIYLLDLNYKQDTALYEHKDFDKIPLELKSAVQVLYILTQLQAKSVSLRSIVTADQLSNRMLSQVLKFLAKSGPGGKAPSWVPKKREPHWSDRFAPTTVFHRGLFPGPSSLTPGLGKTLSSIKEDIDIDAEALLPLMSLIGVWPMEITVSTTGKVKVEPRLLESWEQYGVTKSKMEAFLSHYRPFARGLKGLEDEAFKALHTSVAAVWKKALQKSVQNYMDDVRLELGAWEEPHNLAYSLKLLAQHIDSHLEPTLVDLLNLQDPDPGMHEAVLRLQRLMKERVLRAMHAAMSGQKGAKPPRHVKGGFAVPALPLLPSFRLDKSVVQKRKKKSLIPLSPRRVHEWARVDPADAVEGEPFVGVSPADNDPTIGVPEELPFYLDDYVDIGQGDYEPGDIFFRRSGKGSGGGGEGEGEGDADDEGEGEGEGEEGEPKEGEGGDEGSPGGGARPKPTDVVVPNNLYGQILSEYFELPNQRDLQEGSNETELLKAGFRHRSGADLVMNKTTEEAIQSGMGVWAAKNPNKKFTDLTPQEQNEAFMQMVEQGLAELPPEREVTRTYVEEPLPLFRAVLVVDQDMSGSMYEAKKWAKSFVRTLVTLMKFVYKGNLEVVYVGHDHNAEEYEEKDFWNRHPGGGTVDSEGFKLSHEILEKRYPKNKWNRYFVSIGDAGNSGGDNARAVQVLEKLYPGLQHGAYITVATWGQASNPAYDEFAKTHKWFDTVSVDSSRASVLKAFGQLYGKNRK